MLLEVVMTSFSFVIKTLTFTDSNKVYLFYPGFKQIMK